MTLKGSENSCVTRRKILQSVDKSSNEISDEYSLQTQECSSSSNESHQATTDICGNYMKTEICGIFKGAVLGDELTALAHNAAYQAENAVRKMIVAGWSVCSFHHLPNWMQDNDYLLFGHRPPLPSFDACFKSIFRLHTETGNIWTHLLGCLAFIGIATYFHLWPHLDIQLEDKVAFGIFFLCAIICMGFSTLFHTMNCHSESIGKLFLKLDYAGIIFLIVGSYIPWFYFVFYCHYKQKILYSTMMCTLGLTSLIVSLWNKFSDTTWRPYRAALFMTFALSGIIPAIHFGALEGWVTTVYQNSVFWLLFSGALYIVGTVLYAMRVPERFFPGKFDIWLHSHQIFHIFVIGGAIVHYIGISEVATYRLTGECDHIFS